MTTTEQLINSLEDEITNLFIELFAEAGEQLNIKTWRDRFKLAGNDANDQNSIPDTWEIIFEDTISPYGHFNLHMNGKKPDGFSIDT